MKNQKGFIQIPLLVAIIAGILVLGGGGYYGMKKYQNYQTEKIRKEVATQAEADARQKTQDEAQRQKDSEVEKLKQEVEALKNKKPQIIQQTIVKEVPAPNNSQGSSVPKVVNDLPSIIQQWRPKIAYIACEWRYADTNEVSLRASGSGILINMTDSKDGPMMVVLTNKHVLFNEDKYTPRTCDISLPGMGSVFHVIDEGSFYAFRKSSAGLDWGLVRLQFPNDYMKSLVVSPISICKETALVGDEIVVLGYPGIGSQTDITATEGIISGRDINYYITSAKIEHGNSGGVAISQKNNCYLGIPTFAQVGEIESLARILDARVIFDSF